MERSRGRRSRSPLRVKRRRTVEPVEGVDVRIVCGDVLVVGLDKASMFQENASWMLQTALGLSGKADAAFTFCKERDITGACQELGLCDEEIGLVRLRDPELAGIRVVGTCGKRSVMLAVVIAVVLRGVGRLNDFWQQAHDYKLDEPFSRIIAVARNQTVRAARSGKPLGSSEKIVVEGVTLQIICGRVPMVDVDRSSVFHENVSWLLQTAMGSSLKADSLYNFSPDKEILDACHGLGLKDNEIGLVSMKDKENVLAVGTCGKRSILLALVVALTLASDLRGGLEGFKREMASFNAKLVEPFSELIHKAESLSDKTCRVNCKREGPRNSWSPSSRSPSARPSGSRPFASSRGGSGRAYRGGGGVHAKTDPDLADLDRLLAEYMAETDDDE